MEELLTDNKQGSSTSGNINLEHIYNAIRYLKPEQQVSILSNFKLIELYDIFANNEGYEKYINDLFAVAKEFSNRAIALMALHTEAFMQSMKKKEEFNPVDTMYQLFDCISEADQKRFCEGMFQKKKFFEDAYKVMMVSFQNAVKKQSGSVSDNATEN